MITHISDKQAREIQPGLTRTILGYGERLMLAEISLEKGTEVAAHAHPHEQMTYVVRGSLQFRLGETTFVLSGGESCLMPSGEMHGVIALSDTTVIDAFSPPREDFLD